MTERGAERPVGRRLALVAAIALGAGLIAPVPGGGGTTGPAKAQSCASCHGPDGISRMPGTPHLAGQPAEYLAAQLRAFRSGRRAHEVMSIVAKPLSDADIVELAAWYASIRISAQPP